LGLVEGGTSEPPTAQKRCARTFLQGRGARTRSGRLGSGRRDGSRPAPQGRIARCSAWNALRADQWVEDGSKPAANKLCGPRDGSTACCEGKIAMASPGGVDGAVSDTVVFKKACSIEGAGRGARRWEPSRVGAAGRAAAPLAPRPLVVAADGRHGQLGELRSGAPALPPRTERFMYLPTTRGSSFASGRSRHAGRIPDARLLLSETGTGAGRTLVAECLPTKEGGCRVTAGRHVGSRPFLATPRRAGACEARPGGLSEARRVLRVHFSGMAEMHITCVRLPPAGGDWRSRHAAAHVEDFVPILRRGLRWGGLAVCQNGLADAVFGPALTGTAQGTRRRVASYARRVHASGLAQRRNHAHDLRTCREGRRFNVIERGISLCFAASGPRGREQDRPPGFQRTLTKTP